jgi:hypothetical protein
MSLSFRSSQYCHFRLGRLQVRFGDAMLQLQKQKVGGLGAIVVAGMRYLYVSSVPVPSTIRYLATDHYQRQSFLSLSRPPQPTTATLTNALDASCRGRTDQSHGQPHLSLSRPSQQIIDTPNPGDTSHRCGTDLFHSRHLL